MGKDLWEIDQVSALKGLKIFLWNVRNLFPKIDVVREFARSVGGIDLICVNETWLKPELPDGLISIDGYMLIRNDRLQKRGGGSCIYVSKRLNHEKLPNMVNNSDIELMCITLNGDGLHSQGKICVALAYRPPGGDSDVATERLSESIQQLNETNLYEIVLLGDLNWDCLHSDNGNILELCNTLGLRQVIDTPTRITCNSQTLLDVILTDMKNIAYCGSVNRNVSDHLPVFIVKKGLTEPRVRSKLLQGYIFQLMGIR